MALTGHLSDLSLSELIEFFCNQRKSGRLKVLYPQGAGYFYLHAGSVVDARIGVLHGIDAVYYALTLPNAEFEFSADAQSVHRSINQPWTQVVLEGLRRLDEGISPGIAFPADYIPEPDELGSKSASDEAHEDVNRSFSPAIFGLNGESGNRKPLFIGAVVVAILTSVAVIGVPLGWYSSKATAVVNEPARSSETTPQPQPETSAAPVAIENAPVQQEEDPAAAARRQRERDRRAREAARAQNQLESVQTVSRPTRTGSKRVTVTVTYDESGRVTQASGADATAVRIARQKRFPPGKAGSATITIPIN